MPWEVRIVLPQMRTSVLSCFNSESDYDTPGPGKQISCSQMDAGGGGGCCDIEELLQLEPREIWRASRTWVRVVGSWRSCSDTPSQAKAPHT